VLNPVPDMDSESLYKLRCTLLGHSADVRGVAAGSSNGDTEFIVTGSRDRTTKVWIPT
jgi:phospholipase A-2-activating protein